MNWAMFAVFVSCGSLIVACVAAYISWNNARQQAALQERLKAHDAAFARKRFIVDLWDKMTEVRVIQKDKVSGLYPEAHVLGTLNNLELIATCWQNDLVDKHTLALAFADNYMLRVAEIQGIQERLPNSQRTGPELLQARPIVDLVCGELRAWKQEQLRR